MSVLKSKAYRKPEIF